MWLLRKAAKSNGLLLIPNCQLYSIHLDGVQPNCLLAYRRSQYAVDPQPQLVMLSPEATKKTDR